MDCLKDIAQIVYGFATALGVALAWFVTVRTVPNELRKWRTQHVATKRSLVAGDALIAVANFVPAIELLGSIVAGAQRFERSMVGQPEPAHPGADAVDEISRRFEERVKEIQTELHDLKAAMTQAAVYLDNRESELLAQCWDVFVTMRKSHDIYLMGLRNKWFSSNWDAHHQAWDDVYGARQKGRLSGIVTEIRTLLKPIARLEVVQ